MQEFFSLNFLKLSTETVKYITQRLREPVYVARGGSRNLTFLTFDLDTCLALQKKPDWVLGAEKDGEKVGADKTAEDADANDAAADDSAAADANNDANGGDNQPVAAEVPEAQPQV